MATSLIQCSLVLCMLCIALPTTTVSTLEVSSLHHKFLNDSSNNDPHRSGYHHPDNAAVDSQKENQFSSSSGFVPIAKPLTQDIYDISSSERSSSANHLHRQQQQDPDNNTVNGGGGEQPGDENYHRYFSNHPSYQESVKNEDIFKDYGYSQAPNGDRYYDENRSRPESSNRHNYYNAQEQTDGSKYRNGEKHTQAGNSEIEPGQQMPSEVNSYHHKGYMPPKNQQSSYSMYNDEQSMIHPDSAVHMLKNVAHQPQEYASQTQLNEHHSPPQDADMTRLLNQFNSIKSNDNNMPALSQDFGGANVNEFNTFPDNMGASSISEMSGIAGFQPAPEGGQLPAPPGYKHVGYITIPAGTTNLPNMMSQPSNGLPLIRPIPINSVDMSKLNKGKQDQKKVQDNKASESKPVRSFLSKLNPLNMLRRLRQRRERRQTSDISPNDYMPLSSKYGASYGYGNMGNAYSMSPYAGGGYSSLSGLGGMSGLGGLYSSMSNPSALYSMPNYGSYPYGGYSAYPSYGYMSPSGASSPYSTALTDVKGSATSSSGSDMSASASSPQAASSAANMGMGMPMMMPMPMGGYGMGGYPPMSSMPMSSMPMPYGYGLHGLPPMHSHASSSSQSGGSSSSSSSGDQSNPLSQTLPGGINLSDLLKDEEDEPSKFKKFLGYLNPMNIIKRFRNNTSEEKKRFGRYKRDVQVYLVKLNDQKGTTFSKISRRNDESNKYQPTVETEGKEMNVTAQSTQIESDLVDEMEDILAHDSIPKVVHGRRKGSKRSKYNIMGSRNFEIIRGGTFHAEDHTPLRSSESSEYEQTVSNSNNNNNNNNNRGGNVLSEVEEDIFNNDTPEIMGFQGFNGFSSLYNSLSASNESPNILEITKRIGEPTKKTKMEPEEQKSFQSIEHAAITSSDLKAAS